MKKLIRQWLGIDELVQERVDSIASMNTLMQAENQSHAKITKSLVYNPLEWLECSKFWCVSYGPDQFNPNNVPRNQLPYFYGVDGSSINDHDIWLTKDVSSYVPPEAKAVYVSGFLMISHGLNYETANLGVFFRRDPASETRTYNYISQCVEASTGNGERSGCSTWVPLTPQRTFQFKWKALPPSAAPFQYPNYSAYGGNLRIVAAAG